MMGIVLGLAKSARFWGALAGIGALLGFATWGYHQIYNAGYQAAELKWREQQLVAINTAVDEARQEWELAAEAAEAEIRIETEIVERIRVVEREIPRVIERTVVAGCRDLGPDVQRLFNDAILAGGGNPGADPDAPSEPAD